MFQVAHSNPAKAEGPDFAIAIAPAALSDSKVDFRQTSATKYQQPSTDPAPPSPSPAVDASIESLRGDLQSWISDPNHDPAQFLNILQNLKNFTPEQKAAFLQHCEATGLDLSECVRLGATDPHTQLQSEILLATPQSLAESLYALGNNRSVATNRDSFLNYINEVKQAYGANPEMKEEMIKAYNEMAFASEMYAPETNPLVTDYWRHALDRQIETPLRREMVTWLDSIPASAATSTEEPAVPTPPTPATPEPVITETERLLELKARQLLAIWESPENMATPEGVRLREFLNRWEYSNSDKLALARSVVTVGMDLAGTESPSEVGLNELRRAGVIVWNRLHSHNPTGSPEHLEAIMSDKLEVYREGGKERLATENEKQRLRKLHGWLSRNLEADNIDDVLNYFRRKPEMLAAYSDAAFTNSAAQRERAEILAWINAHAI